jgi:hypothetical protein
MMTEPRGVRLLPRSVPQLTPVGSMQPRVLSSTHQPEILQSVVILHAVQVVDRFVGFQKPTYSALHDKSVLGDVAADSGMGVLGHAEDDVATCPDATSAMGQASHSRDLDVSGVIGRIGDPLLHLCCEAIAKIGALHAILRCRDHLRPPLWILPSAPNPRASGGAPVGVRRMVAGGASARRVAIPSRYRPVAATWTGAL